MKYTILFIVSFLVIESGFSQTFTPYVKIGNQIWMSKNLDVAFYRNGDPIPKVTDTKAWDALTTGAYCYYNNDSTTYAAIYGKLYNWYAVIDPRGLAPTGWHVPTDAEWTTLEKYLNAIIPTGNVGDKMKETGTAHWLSLNTGATNSSGFTALPGGYFDHSGIFDDVGYAGCWWSSKENYHKSAWTRSLGHGYDVSNINRADHPKRNGLSVRCIKD